VAIVNGPTGTENPTLPLELSLAQNYPNPFNPQTSISLTISEKGIIELAVFNILGGKIRTLIEGEVDAGEHTVIFDGKNDSGNPVSAGVYFYRLKTQDGALTRKMVLIK
jgi:flagellar hook assembly protein FlgD